MRISMPIVLACSTLTTLTLYQGYVAFFSGSAQPDDESASKTTKEGAKAAQAKAQQTGAIAGGIAAPEIIAPNGRHPRLHREPAVNRSTASRDGLPIVNVPPTLRSLPTRLAAPQSVDGSAIPNDPAAALQDASDQRQADVIEQSRSDVGVTQSLPFTSVTTPLADVKGHWAESYIESLAAKGVVRGFRDGSFRPDDVVTARQFALMMEKAFTASPVSYSDLQQLHPDRTPTRADAAALIYQTLAKGQAAPLTMAVQVSGAVPRPGIYAIANGRRIDAPADAGVPTVSRAIQRAGGALAGADLHQVQIHRISDTSARQVINVDVRQLLETGDRRRDIVLQQGDKLVIPAAATAASKANTGVIPTPERSVSLVERTQE